MSKTMGRERTPVSYIKRTRLVHVNPGRRSRNGATTAQYNVARSRREMLAR
jgi:hypothetical protein